MTPRPSILLTASYGAGLATGLLHFGNPLGAILVLAAGLLSRRPLPALLAVAAVTGRGAAEIAWSAEQGRCAARLPERSVSLPVRLVEPADSRGGLVELALPEGGCSGTVGARWPAGHPLDAGRTARVAARWERRTGTAGRPAGTLVVTEVGLVSGSPGPGARLRTMLARASRELYGTRAPLVDALMLGRRGGIDRGLQDRFAQSGLVHLLSISGFHVGLIGAWVVLLARLCGARRSPALIVAAIASAAYVAFLGWPAPAARAAALAALVARCRAGQRHVRPDELLAATCLCVLLIDPWAALDLGGWLSATALWGASRFARWTDSALGTGFLARTFGGSLGATLATAPITAWALGTVAPIGILLNFAAIPVAAVAVPGVLASLLLFPVLEPLARPFAAGAGIALHLLELVAAAGAGVPGGHQLMELASPGATLPWLGALSVGLWATAPHTTLPECGRRLGWSAAVVLLWGPVRALLPVAGDGGRDLSLHFLDVGQGDAAVLRTPGGRWILIDAGPEGGGADAGRRVVAPFLERHHAGRLAVAVVSHAHADHLGGLPSVLERVPAELVLEPGADVPDSRYTGFLDRLATTRVPWHPAHAGDRFECDGVRFTVLHPAAGWSGWGEDVNEDSVVLLVEFGAFQALFAGDAGFRAEAAMRGSLRRIDLLKVGHHGSRGSTGDEWLDALTPQVAVLSLGRNDYGHPAPATLRRLAAHGVTVRRTDRDGTVSVTTDGRRMTVRSRAGAASYDVQ